MLSKKVYSWPQRHQNRKSLYLRAINLGTIQQLRIVRSLERVMANQSCPTRTLQAAMRLLKKVKLQQWKLLVWAFFQTEEASGTEASSALSRLTRSNCLRTMRCSLQIVALLAARSSWRKTRVLAAQSKTQESLRETVGLSRKLGRASSSDLRLNRSARPHLRREIGSNRRSKLRFFCKRSKESSLSPWRKEAVLLSHRRQFSLSVSSKCLRMQKSQS